MHDERKKKQSKQKTDASKNKNGASVGKPPGREKETKGRNQTWELGAKGGRGGDKLLEKGSETGTKKIVNIQKKVRHSRGRVPRWGKRCSR